MNRGGVLPLIERMQRRKTKPGVFVNSVSAFCRYGDLQSYNQAAQLELWHDCKKTEKSLFSDRQWPEPARPANPSPPVRVSERQKHRHRLLSNLARSGSDEAAAVPEQPAAEEEAAPEAAPEEAAAEEAAAEKEKTPQEQKDDLLKKLEKETMHKWYVVAMDDKFTIEVI
jgi:hypothetical protein